MLKSKYMNIKAIAHKLNRRDTNLFPRINTITKFTLFALTLVTITYFAKGIFAEGSLYKDKQDAMKKGNNQESWLNEALASNLVSVSQGLVGEIPFKEDGTVDLKAYVPGGAIGATNQMIASLYIPQASGVEYIAQVKDNFLGKPAYAQGVGFKGLQPILPIWKAFRNVIYTFSALLFVGIGIMVMLRVKISPQAVVTIQSSIPQIITTLILVTFSYAIAGLLIDAMYLFQAIVLAVLFNSQNGVNNPIFKETFMAINPSFSELSQANLGTMTSLMLKATPFGAIVLLTSAFMAIVGLAGTALTVGIGTVPLAIGATIGAILLPVIAFIFVLIWIIKFFFGLLKAYIVILIKIILAPLEIGMGAIPNSKIGFSSWLNYLIAHLAIFPISLLFLVLSNMIIEQISGGKLWVPEMIDSDGMSGGMFLPAALGLATILMLSKLPTMIPEFIFSIKPSPYGKAIGENMKSPSALGKLGATTAGDRVGSIVEKNYDKAKGTSAETPGLKWGNSGVQALRHLGVLPRKR